MSKDAGSAVGRYMETFVREAVARAENTVREREGGRGDGFLEVRGFIFIFIFIFYFHY